ncbi:hypothetical protein UlMin_010377 [Ulmus minor]
MAFSGKFGGLLRQSITRNVQSPMPSMLNSIRCMSSNKLFVGGLSWSLDDQSLKEAFDAFGEVVEAKVIMDRDSGRSRGFGFVSFANNDSANSALQSMDGQPIGGRNIRVSFANERPPRSNFGNDGSSGGYRGDGGYGGSRDNDF